MSAFILCVDNNPTDLDRFGQTLGAEGFHVYRAQEIRSAMEIFMRERLDLVLLDFTLARTDGGIVAFEMRRRRPEVKIAFLCSDPCAPMPTQLVDKVIGKSVEPSELVSEVKELVGPDESRAA